MHKLRYMLSRYRMRLFATVSSLVLIASLAGVVLAKEQVVLQYVMSGVEMQERAIREAQAKAFEALNPHIKVKFVWTDGDRLEKLVTLFAAGTAPDIIYMNEWISDLAKVGMLEPLDKYVQKSGMNLDVFYRPALQVGRYKGKLYALPQEISPITMYYNRDKMDEVGLSAPSDNWNWATFLQYAKKLAKPDQKRWAYWSEAWWSGWAPFVYANNGSFWSEDLSRSTVAEPKAREAIEFMVQLMHQHRVTPPPAQMTEWSALAFQKGNTAMFGAGLWVVPEFAKNPLKFRWDVAVWPSNGRQATTAAILSYGISSQSKHKDEAWEFIKFITATDKGQSYVGSSGMALPTLRSRAALDSVSAFAKKTTMNNVEAFVRGAEVAEFELFVPNFAKAHTILAEQIRTAFDGKVPARAAMEEAARRLNTFLKETNP